ncbi:alpha/beta fold hydrolase [Actinoplanes regularis]|uniref:alpha/beta fold hydrolase n=1 Tax=Actinoplanes regularis TaxID=52697 RepID=UPI0025523AF6|nr:alpha/beta fold hydrolase [Actinoplanes regularis]
MDGVSLGYRVAGDPAGPPMVLLHGLGDDERDWHTVLPALADRHRVYALDLRGHGRSSHPGRYSFELMRDDVLGFLDAVEVERGVLVGHSMGGTVAILLAEAAPHRLTHLILEDTAAPRPGALQRPPLDPPDTPTPFDFAVVNAIRAQLTDPDPTWWERTAAVDVPTLVIAGAESHIPRQLLAEMVDRMPDATMVTIPAGHNVHRDQPAEFLAAVDGFLAARAVH